MYSLPAKVIEVKDDQTVIVELKDRTKTVAKKENKQILSVNDFVSVISSGRELEVCGGKITPSFIW